LPKPAAPEISRSTYEELCRIGNNLNQLVRAVHNRTVQIVDFELLASLSRLVRPLAIEVLKTPNLPREAERSLNCKTAKSDTLGVVQERGAGILAALGESTWG
jgi:hypothetical protein